MKKVTAVPPLTYAARRDPWLDSLFDGDQWELDKSDWKDRYATVRSAASAIKQAAEHRGITCNAAIRGEHLYVQAILNGKVKATKKATAAKATPAKAVAKKASPRKRATKPTKAVAKAS
jgi:hypothetical protein